MRDFDKNFTQRTDLADETEEYLREKCSGNLPGICVKKEKIKGFDVHIMNVLDKTGQEASGKPVGRYVTINTGKIWLSDKQKFADACSVIAQFLREFIPKYKSSCMLAALGNKNIIADATGPLTAENFVVTRHIKEADPQMFENLCMRETLCICPGVLGNTGMEAAQIVKGAVESAKPGFVIAVDSLASRRLSRLATTVQICDTGISPGSGINNARKEIRSKSIGVPVIAIGVPTVVEVTTLATDIIRSAAEKSNSGSIKNSVYDIIEEISANESEGFFVTPKETDHIIKDTSKLIGYSINLALHEDITLQEIDEFLS